MNGVRAQWLRRIQISLAVLFALIWRMVGVVATSHESATDRAKDSARIRILGVEDSPWMQVTAGGGKEVQKIGFREVVEEGQAYNRVERLIPA